MHVTDSSEVKKIVNKLQGVTGFIKKFLKINVGLLSVFIEKTQLNLFEFCSFIDSLLD